MNELELLIRIIIIIFSNNLKWKNKFELCFRINLKKKGFLINRINFYRFKLIGLLLFNRILIII